jgi:hypothetical protein
LIDHGLADVLAHGTSDTLADVATQARLSGQVATYPEPALKIATAGDWGRVSGELLTFDDPKTARHRPPGGIPSGRLQPLQTGSRAGM